MTRIPEFRKNWKALYCITEGAGMPVKIGISVRPETRLARMQTETWRQVKMAWETPALFEHEREVHEILASRRIKGEWFMDHDDLIKTMAPSNVIDVLVFAEEIAALGSTPAKPNEAA